MNSTCIRLLLIFSLCFQNNIWASERIDNSSEKTNMSFFTTVSLLGLTAGALFFILRYASLKNKKRGEDKNISVNPDYYGDNSSETSDTKETIEEWQCSLEWESWQIRSLMFFHNITQVDIVPLLKAKNQDKVVFSEKTIYKRDIEDESLSNLQRLIDYQFDLFKKYYLEKSYFDEVGVEVLSVLLDVAYDDDSTKDSVIFDYLCSDHCDDFDLVYKDKVSIRWGEFVDFKKKHNVILFDRLLEGKGQAKKLYEKMMDPSNIFWPSDDQYLFQRLAKEFFDRFVLTGNPLAKKYFVDNLNLLSLKDPHLKENFLFFLKRQLLAKEEHDENSIQALALLFESGVDIFSFYTFREKSISLQIELLKHDVIYEQLAQKEQKKIKEFAKNIFNLLFVDNKKDLPEDAFFRSIDMVDDKEDFVSGLLSDVVQKRRIIPSKNFLSSIEFLFRSGADATELLRFYFSQNIDHIKKNKKLIKTLLSYQNNVDKQVVLGERSGLLRQFTAAFLENPDDKELLYVMNILIKNGANVDEVFTYNFENKIPLLQKKIEDLFVEKQLKIKEWDFFLEDFFSNYEVLLKEVGLFVNKETYQGDVLAVPNSYLKFLAMQLDLNTLLSWFDNEFNVSKCQCCYVHYPFVRCPSCVHKHFLKRKNDLEEDLQKKREYFSEWYEIFNIRKEQLEELLIGEVENQKDNLIAFYDDCKIYSDDGYLSMIDFYTESKLSVFNSIDQVTKYKSLIYCLFEQYKKQPSEKLLSVIQNMIYRGVDLLEPCSIEIMYNDATKEIVKGNSDCLLDILNIKYHQDDFTYLMDDKGVCNIYNRENTIGHTVLHTFVSAFLKLAYGNYIQKWKQALLGIVKLPEIKLLLNSATYRDYSRLIPFYDAQQQKKQRIQEYNEWHQKWYKKELSVTQEMDCEVHGITSTLLMAGADPRFERNYRSNDTKESINQEKEQALRLLNTKQDYEPERLLSRHQRDKLTYVSSTKELGNDIAYNYRNIDILGLDVPQLGV